MTTATPTTPPPAPCGSCRPNCRALATRSAEAGTLCQIHLAWCPDDHHPQPSRAERSILDQRNFRTGG